MVWARSPIYFYKRNDTFRFSRAVPSDLQSRSHKQKIKISIRTKSEAKAAKPAAALPDRQERYWDSLRMEMLYSTELGLKALQNATSHANATYPVSGAPVRSYNQKPDIFCQRLKRGWSSEEALRLNSRRRRKSDRKKERPVLCIETQMTYNSISDAARELSSHAPNTGKVVKSKMKSAGKRTFMYVNEDSFD